MSDAGREHASDGAREKQPLRSSLKSSNYTKMTRSVTWADENIDKGTVKKMECSSEISEEADQAYRGSGPTDMEEVDDSYRFESAEACAAALKQAAKAVASGSDVPDAVSNAGIIILPPPQEVDKAILQENDEVLDTKPAPLKWPRKQGVPNYDVFESEDSWYDSPPEGFNLNVLLIDTMSFVDPLPAFRIKQWQLIVLLFLDALSICRIPVLTPYMTGRRTLLPKVLDGAQISAVEYEIMKDLIIPLGRVPQFSMQSGG
uniref:RNA polymerase II subunit B1 CTD phosphatase RPAP2 homolog n=1 Tax=Nicotiana tabacum TaxID=4097 RepID=A0A1S3YQT9_TOBAC|nr:PREDICTED: putative RNA polymerase II subunit B1 CTD phosphatase RPAP2 homolog [Nicotiana tabacum]XP_016454340.1 PREDICTED: putative RNA polymerase II subunit B1 CTD phosphatase RPAP2 homolog [Nicotiana tabacum]